MSPSARRTEGGRLNPFHTQGGTHGSAHQFAEQREREGGGAGAPADLPVLEGPNRRDAQGLRRPRSG